VHRGQFCEEGSFDQEIQTGLVQNYALLRRIRVRQSIYCSCVDMNHYLDHPLHAAGGRAHSAAGQQRTRTPSADIANPVALAGFAFRSRRGSGISRRASSSSSSNAPWIPSIGAGYFLGVDGF
jgi:hypothetical protein